MGEIMERVDLTLHQTENNSFVEQNENMIQDFQKINKVYRDSGIHDITNKCNQNKPSKIKPYASISDDCNELFKKKQEKSNFMNRWNASVVDSIDFQGSRKSCDVKDCKDALNCAL